MIELLYGVWYMLEACTLWRRAWRAFQELGGDLRTSSPVEEIVVRRRAGEGVIVDGAFYPADAWCAQPISPTP